MVNRPQIAFAAFLAILMTSCQTASTPPVGWRSPVYQLLIDDSALPVNWTFEATESITSTDPATNHVSRSWIHGTNIAWESIWRAYTIDDAKEKYNELSQEFEAPRISTDGHIYVDFLVPAEISFRSSVADEYNLACGWWDRPYCLVIARYRNYVVKLRIDQKAEFDGVQADGMTYAEIETLIRAMDAKFVEFYGQLTATAIP